MEQVQHRNILNEAMLPSAEICFGTDAWIFQQDNDPKHTAIATKAQFVDNSAPVMADQDNPVAVKRTANFLLAKEIQAGKIKPCTRSAYHRKVEILNQLLKGSYPNYCDSI